MTPIESTTRGATVVITHQVRPGKEAAYEKWLEEIGPICRAAPGHLDWHLVHPIPDLTSTYTIVIRFDTTDNLTHWMHSHDRERLIEIVQPLLASGDSYSIKSGLDFLFTPVDSNVKVPVRWKQFLITWSAIYPLVLVVPLGIIPLLHWLGLPVSRWITTFFVTGCVVFLMIYLVMPHYTKLVRSWLFK